MEISTKWGTQMLLAVDQLVNAIFAGSADETISARSYRMATRPDPKRRWVVARRLIDWLFWFDPGHTQAAYLAEVERQHMRGEYRKRQASGA